jgi:hypothetical protein
MELTTLCQPLAGDFKSFEREPQELAAAYHWCLLLAGTGADLKFRNAPCSAASCCMGLNSVNDPGSLLASVVSRSIIDSDSVNAIGMPAGNALQSFHSPQAGRVLIGRRVLKPTGTASAQFSQQAWGQELEAPAQLPVTLLLLCECLENLLLISNTSSLPLALCTSLWVEQQGASRQLTRAWCFDMINTLHEYSCQLYAMCSSFGLGVNTRKD